MQKQTGRSSWVTFTIFYLVLILIVTLLDNINNLLTVPYWSLQITLLTVGVGVFALIGYTVPDLTPNASVLLAFTVGVMTIIPAILMGLGTIPGFWQTYFSIAGGMAGGSLLTFIFMAFSRRLTTSQKAQEEEEIVKRYLNQ